MFRKIILNIMRTQWTSKDSFFILYISWKHQTKHCKSHIENERRRKMYNRLFRNLIWSIIHSMESKRKIGTWIYCFKGKWRCFSFYNFSIKSWRSNTSIHCRCCYFCDSFLWSLLKRSIYENTIDSIRWNTISWWMHFASRIL